ncbi:MAG: type II toxin-antitoxin system HipA family toxin YjjJ [Gammaproteobacteria bacterium]|nr:type II toxin-antitoxin system HipA family toxin YjjJ [Gammaproteobacteria bacterium]
MPSSIIEKLRQNPASVKELQFRTGQSQATVSRQLRSLGNSVVSLGSGRNIRYALVKNAFAASDYIPLYAVEQHGNNVQLAVIRPLAHGGYLVEQTTATPSVLLGENGDGVFDDLPYFLDDLGPQGFLGRQIAQKLSESSGFPSDPRQWSAEHIGSYLIANGDDLPGNFKLGGQTAMRLPREIIATNRDDYNERAKAVLQGHIPGSSAGGTQPKFTAYTEDHGHVIVKFSLAGDDPVSRRWRDILLTEYHAEKILRQTRFPAVDSQTYEIGDRLFLESRRFDRQGAVGRIPMISLLAIDAEFVGEGSNWPRVMKVLAGRNLISEEHYYDTRVLYEFGRCIHNTDMHSGNPSLGCEGDVFRLLPVYDMCSMGFAPKSGEVTPYKFQHDVSLREDIDKVIHAASKFAIDFWNALAGDDRISTELREFFDQGNPVRLLE